MRLFNFFHDDQFCVNKITALYPQGEIKNFLAFYAPSLSQYSAIFCQYMRGKVLYVKVFLKGTVQFFRATESLGRPLVLQPL